MSDPGYLVAAALIWIVLLPWASRAAHRLCRRVAGWGLRTVRPDAVVAATRVLRLCFFWSPAVTVEALLLRASADADAGRTDAAVKRTCAFLDLCRQLSPLATPWGVVNTAIDVLVNAGCYQLAIDAADRWSPQAQADGRAADPLRWAYCQINLAEARHCRGEDAEAAARLDAAGPCVGGDPVASHGLALMRVWLLAHERRWDEARAIATTVDGPALTPRYQAEYHYTLALVALGLGELDEAERQARAGREQARRASSRRNALHVQARIALARGHVDRAIEALEAFARHPYRAQCGPALRLLATTYEQQGRAAEAERVRAWIRERDPEGAAALPPVSTD